MLDVDIYSVELDAAQPAGAHPAGAQPEAARIVSPEELARARAFFFERDRRRYLHCRARLREILSAYVGRAPERIEFRVNAFGKPSTSRVFFNVSHSHDLALIAVSRTREVGIDVERIDAKFMRDNIPERFFSPSETAALRALPAAQRLQAFFDCWTRKEAYVKARGVGLSLALSSFDVTLAPNQPAAFLRGAGDWSIESIAARPGFAAALVAQGAADCEARRGLIGATSKAGRFCGASTPSKNTARL